MDEMDRLADLKDALSSGGRPSDQLRARALAAMTDPGAPARRRRLGPGLAAAAGVAVVAAGAVMLGGSHGSGTGPTTPAAFTLDVNVDGSVTFTAHDIVDTVAATQALNNAGIAGRVINDQTAGCATKADDIAPEDLYPDNTLSRGLGTSATVTFRSSDYPAGGGLMVVITSRGEENTMRSVAVDPVAVAIFAFDDAGKIPTCVDFADPGSGGNPSK